MSKRYFLAVVALLLIALTPQVEAGFTSPPTFDLTATSNVAGSATALYTIHLQNSDPSEDVVSISITIPAGYSIGSGYMTSTSGIQVGSVSGSCQGLGTGVGSVLSTSTPGKLAISVLRVGTIGEIDVSEPTATTPGKMTVLFSGTIGFDNHGCQGSFTMVQGFLINPSTAGTYTWTATATPTSGSPVTLAPRPGRSQTITIVS